MSPPYILPKKAQLNLSDVLTWSRQKQTLPKTNLEVFRGAPNARGSCRELLGLTTA